MKLDMAAKQRKVSKHGKRKFTQLDMATVKHTTAIINSQIKRGELVPPSKSITVTSCGCGVEGCFYLGFYNPNPPPPIDLESWDSLSKEEKEKILNASYYKK